MEIRYRKERQKKSSRYLILKKKDLDEEIEPQIIPNVVDKIDYIHVIFNYNQNMREFIM